MSSGLRVSQWSMWLSLAGLVASEHLLNTFCSGVGAMRAPGPSGRSVSQRNLVEVDALHAGGRRATFGRLGCSSAALPQQSSGVFTGEGTVKNA